VIILKKIPDKIIVAAMKASARSNLIDYHLGACIYKKNEIISTGFNRSYHCGDTIYLPRFNYSLHAEEDALFGLPRRLTYGASIFIYREGNNLAKPCSRCQKAISKAGISHIYYSPI
jgi:deoxycytidylate deaminase